MLFVGITGGVGAGKSEILNYLGRHHGTRVMLADEIAHELMEPGTECFEKLAELFRNEDIFQKDGHFDRKKLASVIFADEEKRNLLNGIVHPAVKEYVCEQVQAEEKAVFASFWYWKRLCLLKNIMMKYVMNFGIFIRIEKFEESV